MSDLPDGYEYGYSIKCAGDLEYRIWSVTSWWGAAALRVWWNTSSDPARYEGELGAHHDPRVPELRRKAPNHVPCEVLHGACFYEATGDAAPLIELWLGSDSMDDPRDHAEIYRALLCEVGRVEYEWERQPDEQEEKR